MPAVSSLRAASSLLFIAVVSVIGSLLALPTRLFDRSGDTVLDLARLWARLILRYCGVQLDVRWRCALDNRRPYVFMANHLSAVDIWVLLVALPVRVRMIAKKQLGWIPLFGWAMRAGRFIFIDRGNAVKARRSIDLAKSRIRGGDSVLLFPEGTRSRDGRLQPFKKGGFHLAIDAGVPVVPIALAGPRELMPPGSFFLRAGRVVVTVGEPIPTEGLSDAHRNELLERVHAEIAGALGEAPVSPARPEPAEPPPPTPLERAERSSGFARR